MSRKRFLYILKISAASATGISAVGVLWRADSIITSCLPTPVTRCFKPSFIRFLSPSKLSAENLLGVTLIFQLPSEDTFIISPGVLSSLPGQKGQFLSWSGRYFLSLFWRNSLGRFARSVAIITHSLVIRFNLSSGIL